MKSAVQLYQMYKRSIQQEEDYSLLEQFRDNKYDQNTLRELFGITRDVAMIDFWSIIAHNQQYSKEFIIEWFNSCSKKERETIDETIRGEFGCLWDDLRPQDSQYVYMQKIMNYKSYLINAGKYFKYCKNEFNSAQSLYEFFEQNLNICIDDILSDYEEIYFLFNKRFYEN